MEQEGVNKIQAFDVVTRTEAIKVLNSFFEDDKKNLIFYYTGKDSVLGLSHPDYIMKNSDKHNYARVAFYTFNEIGDDSILVYMNETLDIMTVASTVNDINADKMQNFKIHFEAIGEAGRVKSDTVRCTVSNCNTIVDSDKTIPEVLVTEDYYLTSENKTKYGVGLWIDISDMTYVLTNVDKSISANSVPIDTEHFPSSYTATYLSNANKEDDKNLLKVVDLLNDRIIIKSTDSEHFLDQRLKNLEEKTKYEPHQFIQNTVVYNPTHIARAARTEEVVQGTTIRGSSLDRIIILDPVEKVFRVKQYGIYMLQLKNGFYLVQGETRLDLKVYKNSEQIKEMGISAYLTSNPEGKDDAGKVIKNLYSSNVYVLELTPSDKIKLTANWMDINNLVLENETMMCITALQYNIPN